MDLPHLHAALNELLSELGFSSESSLETGFERIRTKLAENSPELSVYHDIYFEWVQKCKRDCVRLNKTSFDDLEHRLLRQFFLRAVKDLSALVSRSLGSLSEETVRTDIRKVLSQAGAVVNALTIVAKHGPTEEGKSQPDEQVGGTQSERTSNSDRQDVTSRPAAALVVTDASRRFPALPPEIVKEILSHVAAVELQASFENQPATLFSCALVNKTWSQLGQQALYRRLELSNVGAMYNFAFPRLWTARLHVPGLVPTLPSMDASSYVQELELSNLDRSGVWNAVLHTLYLFPNLRHLALKGIQSLYDLHPLFDQTLPSLQKLSLQGDSYFPWLNWEVGAVYNRERARAFFSHLLELKFSCCSMKMDLDKCPEFVDTAHKNLRSITLPDDTPAHIATQFFAKCSDALVAVDTNGSYLSLETLGTIATKCTRLRALAVENTDIVDVDGLVSLIEKCGPELICLDVVSSDRLPIPRPVMQSIMRHCRSLEALRLESQGDGFEEDCVELVSRLGGRLKYLDLHLATFDIHANTLVNRVAENCPFLEGFSMPFSVELYVSDPPEEQQEGEEGQSPQPQQSTADNMPGNEVLEESFAKLLRQCPKLQLLNLCDDFAWSHFTDRELKANVMRLFDVDFDLHTHQIRKYFDYAFYSRRPSRM
ncbi:hypothetical protein HK102_001033 [Quaeritorhiza haematococci]|nr:hypothetical protein HK102_001033 [Quaeritorhiza haematococci]